VLVLFKWFISSWFNFGRWFVSRNLWISSRFFTLLEYKLSKYCLMIFWISLASVVLSSFLSLILLIWVFSLFFWLVWLRVYFSCLSCQRPNFLFHWFFLIFLVYISSISAKIFIISFYLLIFCLICYYFSNSLRYSIFTLSFLFLNVGAHSYKLSY
jgi:hypothetical protein